LPTGDDEFAVMTTITITRRGTNVNNSANEVLSLLALYIADVQVDFWSADERCLERALALEAFAISESGVVFALERGVSLIDCPGGVKDMSTVADADEYVRRATLTIQLEFWNAVLSEEWSTPGPLRFKYLENVDEHHPPIGD
jgi:hypothetical protein